MMQIVYRSIKEELCWNARVILSRLGIPYAADRLKQYTRLTSEQRLKTLRATCVSIATALKYKQTKDIEAGDIEEEEEEREEQEESNSRRAGQQRDGGPAKRERRSSSSTNDTNSFRHPCFYMVAPGRWGRTIQHSRPGPPPSPQLSLLKHMQGHTRCTPNTTCTQQPPSYLVPKRRIQRWPRVQLACHQQLVSPRIKHHGRRHRC